MESLRSLAKSTLLRYDLDPSEHHPDEADIDFENAATLEERVRQYITGQGFAVDWMAKSRDDALLEVHELKKQLERAREKNKRLREERGRLGRDNDDLKYVEKWNEDLRREVTALKGELRERDEEIEGMHGEYLELNERFKKSMDEVKALEVLKKSNKRLMMENEAFRKDLDTLEAEVAATEEEVRVLKKARLYLLS